MNYILNMFKQACHLPKISTEECKGFRCVHIYHCSPNFHRCNPVFSMGIHVIWKFVWGQKIPCTDFEVAYMDLLHWPRGGCLVWKIFIHCCATSCFICRNLTQIRTRLWGIDLVSTMAHQKIIAHRLLYHRVLTHILFNSQLYFSKDSIWHLEL